MLLLALQGEVWRQVQVVLVKAAFGPHLDHVAEAVGRDQRGLGAQFETVDRFGVQHGKAGGAQRRGRRAGRGARARLERRLARGPVEWHRQCG